MMLPHPSRWGRVEIHDHHIAVVTLHVLQAKLYSITNMSTPATGPDPPSSKGLN